MRFNRTLLHRLYEVAIGGVVVSSVLYGIALSPLVTAFRGATRELGLAGLLAVLLTASAATASGIATRIGPLWATRLELTWLDPLPLIRRRRRRIGVAGLVVSVSLGVVAAAAATRSGLSGAGVGAAAVAVVVLSLALAHVGQLLDVGGWVRGGGLVCAGTAAAILAGNAGAVPLAVLGLAVLYLAALAARPQRRPVRGPSATPPRWELVRAGTFVEALRASTVMLDGSALELVRDTQLPPQRSSTPRRESALFAVRALTSPRVAVLLPALCLPAGAGSIWGTGAAACVLTLTTFFFGWRVSRPLEVFLSHPALRRAYAARGRRLPVLVAGTTLTLTVLYAGAGAATGSLSAYWGLAAAAFSTLGILRRLSGRRLAGRVGALLSTPMGPVPADLARRVIAGTDVAIAGTAVSLTQGAAASAAVVALTTAAYFAVFTLRGR